VNKENINKLSKEILENEDLSMLPKIHQVRCALASESEQFLNTIKCVVVPRVLMDAEGMEDYLSRALDLLYDLCLKVFDDNNENTASKMCDDFALTIPRIAKCLVWDLQAAYNEDPAAKSIREIVLSYPGFQAVIIFRIAHELYKLNMPLLPRIFTEYAHKITGIDIHPGAKIGKSFFIDHGTGVVIGETCEIGENVKIYQGVTLGAKSFKRDENGNPIKGIKRHPNIGNNVVIYSGATILGGDTTVGENSVIGGNVWITYSVPPDTKIFR